MTNRIQEDLTRNTAENSTNLPTELFKNIEEIHKVVQGLSQRFGNVEESLNTTNQVLNRFDQKVRILEKQISESQSQIKALQAPINGLEEKLDNFDKRFKFVASKFTNLTQQMDHLDSEFGSLKTMVLAAVDKSMKEYSNFVVEKLSLGTTIDTLRLEVDKLKAKIQRLEEAL